MKNKAKKKGKSSEFQALLCLALSVIFLLSLSSFSIDTPKQNYLGYLGYYLGFIANYLFGFGSYLFVFYFATLSFNFFVNKKIDNLSLKSFSFFMLLFSVCMLMTIFADSYPDKLVFLQKKIITEDFYRYRPKEIIFQRYNLGGVPFYFIYKDLDFFSLQNILSKTGNTLIFSITAFISFFLFTNINLFSILKKGVLLIFQRKNFIAIKNQIVSLIGLMQKKSEYPQKKEINVVIKELKPLVAPKVKEPPVLKTEEEKKIKITTNNIQIHKPKDDKRSSYKLPSLDLLTDPKKIDHPTVKKELKRQSEILESTLKNFGIEAKVGDINCGPTITSFEVHPSTGVKVQKIKTLENDIALNLEAKSIRIIAPIPGKAAVGVEIPSIYPQEVSLKEMISYYNGSSHKLNIPILLGKTVTGEYLITDLTKMPHLLIAGATGSGKSVCINTIVMSILMNCDPEEVKLMLVDPKKVELTQYSNLPHMIAPVITEPHGAYSALHFLVKEMQNRYDILKLLSLRNITSFNSRKINKEFEGKLNITIPEKMPIIVGIIDEFADLMMASSSDLETPIARIAQMARAVGIHLILATQRPSREVITGIIKANFPCRIAFKVASRINSQIILDEIGAESLLGNGDLLFAPPGSSQLLRAQGAYIRDEDINKVIANICDKNPTNYLINSFDNMPKMDETSSTNTNAKDQLYDQALQIVVSTRNASTTFLQRKLKIGYARAASLMDELELNGVIGPQEGSKARKILSFDEPL
ncbi:MAG: DNA translocase FtsK 4TM domain-containing protein [Chlamydiae bacterium]|nr:DNA translocase FtsK 4TM domain-containing protein [Chlamydiota bacterium]